MILWPKTYRGLPGLHCNQNKSQWPVIANHSNAIWVYMREPLTSGFESSDLPKFDPHLVSVVIFHSKYVAARRRFKICRGASHDEVVILDTYALFLVTSRSEHPNVQQGVAQLISVEPDHRIIAELN